MTNDELLLFTDELCANNAERLALELITALADLYERGERSIAVSELCDILGEPAPLVDDVITITDEFVKQKEMLLALLQARNTPKH